jgi:hypothetical protein
MRPRIWPRLMRRMGEAYFLERKEDPENRRIAVENLNRAIEKDSSSYWPHLISRRYLPGGEKLRRCPGGIRKS